MLKWNGMIIGLLLIMVLMPGAVFASRGGTDANGGHYDHSTGLYHYHHGYPAHQHENGICPYTGEKWELSVPERPATLEEWNAQKHPEGEKPPIDNELPENDQWDDATETDSGTTKSVPVTAPKEIKNAGTETGDNGAKETKDSGTSGRATAALPIAAAGGAAVLAGAVAIARGRRKKDVYEAPASEPVQVSEHGVSTPEPDMSPEAVIPEGTVIGDDGLPWETEAYAREKERVKTVGAQAGCLDRSVATNFSEPKWGSLYSFCTDADGEEIHTLTCEMAFIQINVADKNCPKADCPVCKPIRPDLGWYEEYLKRKAAQQNDNKIQS